MDTLEIVANIVMALAIILAGRNSIHSWWLGIAGCLLFSVLFYSVRLYADVALQIFFIVTCIIGWREWAKGDHGHALPITSVKLGAMAWMTVGGIVGAAVYGLLLHKYTNAYAPFIDSSVLAFSIMAQLLLMARRIETWPVWVLVNAVSVPLYLSRGLTLTAVLYAGYFINALVSWRWWRKEMQAARP
ncbi:nicotinamide riboside transporter PnuC [Pseudoduganella ginsengisoli]|uniref:Nicotinamide riboside transporter PnuC n=1 Tax=Pseudoduganella ginsengisoli TaxID=1462440 RepID=A0A6L6Q5L6_9BURK|nr:nicotinamide riboside transporter PnuC [Pseudoduganella ginsengisoli]MTW05047.1 nicotinamide riboside transporter PnuC [Pseudoduganella ginsengisoli]